LILSYVFIGCVPALLIVSFFLLCGFLLFYNFSSYLVQSRLHALSEQARALAQGTVLEIQRGGGQDIAAVLTRSQASAADQFPGLSLVVVAVDKACPGTAGARPQASGTAALRLQPSDVRAAGPWRHLAPPRAVPAWIGCSGYSGIVAYSHRKVAGVDDEDTHLVARAVAFPDSSRPTYAVVQQQLSPLGFVVTRRLCLLLLGFCLVDQGHLRLFLRLDHLEERVAEQLLFQVLLEVEERHVEQIHRLVQAGIDPQLLAERRVLVQAGLHAAGVSRARRRAVRVGPK
jgi:hypothetical protein